MAKILKRSTHMHWEDWLSVGAGCVIVISPWLAGAADSEFAVLNAIVIGLLVLSVGGLELGDALQRWEEWIELALGLWLAASPWVLGYNRLSSMTATHVALGGVVAMLACFELWQDRSGIPPVRRID
jgi:hypothetical protein